MVGVGSAALFATLSWCATRSGAGVQCEGSALERLLRGRFCEEALGAPICPEKFFAYLDVRLSLWSVAFPSCSTFTPTMYGDVLNEFAIMASTDVKSDADYDVGALLLRFENTTSRDPAWSSLADDRMCSVECMSRRRDSGSIRVASLSVQCPTDDNIANMLPLSSCAAAEASLMLHPEGRTVCRRHALACKRRLHAYKRV
eukprot:6210233-Pleurochrysis_carterae.AAC.4